MKSRSILINVATLLIGVLIVAPIFPKTVLVAHAQSVLPAVPTAEIATSVLTFETTLAEIATSADWLNKNVLIPLALIKSIGLMKAMTAGVIAFINGAANGTGSRQFVQNVDANLQRVGDVRSQAFLLQLGRNSGSPFASSITTALRTSYLQQTSLAGFWAANRNTLALSSPNINAFLAGNWSQGGAKAWLSLTTQPQNNPYTFYQTSQSMLAGVVAAGQATRKSALDWGQGILSWCGPSDSSGNAMPDAGPGDAATNSGAGPADGTVCDFSNAGTQDGIYQGGKCVATGTHGSAAINPGDPCTNSDGTPGTIKTPGSVITAGLNKALSVSQDKIVQIGNIGSGLASVLGSIATVLQTVYLAEDILRGPTSKGLAGVNMSGSAANAAFSGLSTATLQSAKDTLIPNLRDRITQYEAAQATITSAAIAAETALNSLASSCATQAAQAQIANQNIVAAVLNNSKLSPNYVQRARILMSRVMAATIESIDPNDIALLQTISPTDAEVVEIKRNATETGQAVANPEGSLSVSGGTTVDQMKLLSKNAGTLAATCGGGT